MISFEDTHCQNGCRFDIGVERTRTSDLVVVLARHMEGGIYFRFTILAIYCLFFVWRWVYRDIGSKSMRTLVGFSEPHRQVERVGIRTNVMKLNFPTKRDG